MISIFNRVLLFASFFLVSFSLSVAWSEEHPEVQSKYEQWKLHGPNKILKTIMKWENQYDLVIENKIDEEIVNKEVASDIESLLKEYSHREAFNFILSIDVDAISHAEVLNAAVKILGQLGGYNDVQAVLRWWIRHSRDFNDSERILEQWQFNTLNPALEQMKKRREGAASINYFKNVSFKGKTLDSIYKEVAIKADLLMMSYRLINHTQLMVEDYHKSGELLSNEGRETELRELENTFLRIKGKTAVLVGLPGVGKTELVRIFAQKMALGLVPNSQVFADNLAAATVFEVSAGALKDNVKEFSDEVLKLEKTLGFPIIVFIDELHSLKEDGNNADIEALKVAIESQGLKIIGASTSNELQNSFKNNPAFLRRIKQIAVTEFSPKITKKMLKKSWLPRLTKSYNVSVNDRVLEEVIRLSAILVPESPRPDGPIRLLQDLMIEKHRGTPEGPTELLLSDLYHRYQKITGLPADPSNLSALVTYSEKLKGKMKMSILGQDYSTDRLVDNWTQLLSTDSTKPRVVMMMGPTGTGKTFSALELVRHGINRPGAVLEINASEFAASGTEPEMIISKLMGAGPGYISSDETSGIIPEYLDDPSRGKFGGVIIINEAEKMPVKVWIALMEFFDRGVLTGGDGKTRKSGKHLVILTSNRGARRIFPPAVAGWSQIEIERQVESYRSQAKLKELYLSTDIGNSMVLPPEIVNRIDEYVVVNPISNEVAVRIGQAATDKIVQEFRSKNGLEISVDKKLISHISLAGFSMSEGARQIIRQIDGALRSAVLKVAAQKEFSKKTPVTMELGKNVSSEPVLIVTAGSFSAQIPLHKGDLIAPTPKSLVEKLKNLEKSFAELVIGQQELGITLADSLLAALTDNTRRRPVTVFVIGTTGTGKTETGKTIAKVLYGSQDRAEILDLGELKDTTDLDKVFGSKYEKHVVSPFEQALINNPQGGVIVFDEASNMGAGNLRNKEALFKSFYKMIDEGHWTSTAGKDYDLSKFLFLFTGNDGERLFQGSDSDEMRLLKWKGARAPENLGQLLKSSGVPEAFLGRLSSLVLAKPLTSAEIGLISKKFLNMQKESIKLRYGVDISYSADFAEQISSLFFTQAQGARSVRKFVEDRLGAMIVKALSEAEALERDSGAQLTIQMKIQRPKGFYRKMSDEIPKYEVQIQVKKGLEAPVNISRDITDMVPQISLLSEKEALKVAYHEAGHAVVNIESTSGLLIDHINIVPKLGSDAAGYVIYTSDPSVTSLTRASVVNQIATMYAGTIAQQKMGYPLDSGWSSDRQKIHEIAEKAILEMGLEPKLFMSDLKKLNSQEKRALEKARSALIENGQQEALRLVDEKWPFIERLAKQLMIKGVIYRAEFLDLMSKPKATPPARTEEKNRSEVKAKSKQVINVRCEALYR